MTGQARKAGAERKVKPLTRKALLVVLEVIENIVGDDDCVMWDLENANRRFRGDKKRMANKLSAVYRLAHSAIDTHSCFGVHEDWRKEGREPHPNASA